MSTYYSAAPDFFRTIDGALDIEEMNQRIRQWVAIESRSAPPGGASFAEVVLVTPPHEVDFARAEARVALSMAVSTLFHMGVLSTALREGRRSLMTLIARNFVNGRDPGHRGDKGKERVKIIQIILDVLPGLAPAVAIALERDRE